VYFSTINKHFYVSIHYFLLTKNVLMIYLSVEMPLFHKASVQLIVLAGRYHSHYYAWL